MKKLNIAIFFLAAILFFLNYQLFAQLSAPNVESVYGGRINAITGFAKTGDTSRIFISTESANSIFYADVYVNPALPVFGDFSVMPGVDASAGYGANISQIAAHQTSGAVFFVDQSGLLSSHPASSTVQTVFSGGVNGLMIKDDYIFFIAGGSFYFGTLNAVGTFTAGAGSPISILGSGGSNTIFVNPVSDTVYVFSEGTVPKLFRMTDDYMSFSVSTSANDISPASLSPSVIWNAFGIAPSGRLFVIGNDGAGKFTAYSDDESTWTSYATGLGGVTSSPICFSGNASNYNVYNSSVFNNNNGLLGSWMGFGDIGGFETHANDGAVFVDPLNEDIIYMTTDQGIGASVDGGGTIFEIDDGVEAVQVSDFDMTADKTSAWLASKSGIRKVVNYLTSPSWTNAIFPQGDGSPYYSVEMDHSDTNVVYAGNVRIYKSADSGSNWQQIFTPEISPFNFPSVGTKALAIEVCDFEPNIVMAGFEIWNSDKGGLFVSLDAGSTWDQILIEASTSGQDVDVSDIEFNIESGDTVAYASALYDLSAPQGRSVYKLTKSGTSWSVQQDMNSTGTSSGSLIVATIWDLEVSVTGDTIFAAGTDAGINHPIAYYKPLNTSGLWTTFTTSGFPFYSGKEATAITIGVDTVYVAVDEEIYFYDLASGTAWNWGYAYPVGTRINFLFYDELLAGTTLGLYGHFGAGGATSVGNNELNAPNDFVLFQNYPNPFNPSTVIKFSIPQQSFVTLTVYNLLGERVAQLIDGELSAGDHSTIFSASHLSSGVYVYQLRSGGNILSRKMLLLK